MRTMRNFIQENFYILTAMMLTAVFISNDAFLPAIPSMAVGFESSEARLQQGVSAFALGALLLQVFVGPLSDRYGCRLVMIIGAWLFLLGSLGCILAPDINMFLLSRIFQGFAMASTQVSSMAAINKYYERNKAISALALSSNITLLAPMLGPILGAIVLAMPVPDLLHSFALWAWGSWQAWRFIFIYIGILGLCATLMLMVFMPEPSKLPAKISALGQAEQKSLFHIFKQLPLLLSNRLIVLYSVSVSMGGFAMLLWITGAPVMLITNLGLSENGYAWIQAPVFLCMIVGNSIGPAMARRFGGMCHMNIIHMTLVVASPFIFLGAYLWQTSAVALVIAFSVFSFCVGAIIAVKNQFIISLSEYKGSVTSVIMLVNTIGVFFGTLAASFLGKYPNYWSFVVIAVAAFLLGALALLANVLMRNSPAVQSSRAEHSAKNQNNTAALTNRNV